MNPPALSTIARRYHLHRLLGEGGMGAVYEAEHLITRRRVALKLLHPNLAWTPSAVERFINEAQIAAALGHPNIIDVLDAGVDDNGAPFIVFEFLRGASVGDMLRSGPLPLDRALEITADVLSALVAAHGRGVLHRDIKPDNVFVAANAKGETTIKLLDFGIARAAAELNLSPRAQTKTGSQIGTPAYMSPEQVRGQRDIDARTDVWSVGVMLYEMLSGALPFSVESTTYALLLAIAAEPHTPLAAVAPELPPSVLAIVDGALMKDRDARTPSSAVMLQQVQRVRAELGFVGGPRSIVSPPSADPLPADDIGTMPTCSGPSPVPSAKTTLAPIAAASARRRSVATTLPLALLATFALVGVGLVARHLRTSRQEAANSRSTERTTPTASPGPSPVFVDAGAARDALVAAGTQPPGPSAAAPSRHAAPPRRTTRSRPADTRLAPAPQPRRSTPIRPVTGFDGV